VSARLDRAQAAAREYATSTVKPAMTELANNPLTNKLLEQYFQLSSLAADYAKRFGTEHMATVKLRQRAEEVRTGLINDLERLSQTLLSEKTILERHVQDLERALNTAVGTSRTQEGAQVKLQERESIAQSYRALYDGLLSRHSEAVVQEEQPISGARLISPALEPLSKVMKKPLLISALLALGATGLGLALSLLRDLKDRTFRTGDDIERMLRSEFIGMIPTWRPGLHPAARAGRALILANANADQHVLRKNSVYWALMLAPTSAFAEAIGRVKFAILRQSNDDAGRISGLTSVLPNEGASTVASAVVQSLAKSGRSVILVDCDLRHPELTKEIAAHAKVGLQEILFGDARLDDAILTDAASGFAFLPGVLGRLRARPEELLETDALTEVLIELRQRYEYVIVDLPPMFPMLDVSMTDRVIEGYIVVVEWGSSKIDTVAHALARCPGVRNRMLG